MKITKGEKKTESSQERKESLFLLILDLFSLFRSRIQAHEKRQGNNLLF